MLILFSNWTEKKLDLSMNEKKREKDQYFCKVEGNENF